MMGPAVELGMSFLILRLIQFAIPIKPFMLQEVSLNETCSEAGLSGICLVYIGVSFV
jgi:hypothetical protein